MSYIDPAEKMGTKGNFGVYLLDTELVPNMPSSATLIVTSNLWSRQSLTAQVKEFFFSLKKDAMWYQLCSYINITYERASYSLIFMSF